MRPLSRPVNLYVCPKGRFRVSESTNGLLRRYFPKRTDFRQVSQARVDAVVARLNSTPRKVLDYRTPVEAFTAHFLRSVRIES